MKQTRKNKIKNKKKEKKHTLTIKRGNYKDLILQNSTPSNINKISKRIARGIYDGSYSPTINKELITLKSIPRKELLDCNIEEAYTLKAPLQIEIYGKEKNNCHYYYTQEAKKFLLHNLSADKHIVPNKVVPPIQSQSNCWFNTMFVTFFVSDKGRKFFHFLRQLMIEGKQQDGTTIPKKLNDIFALLNFGIDACLTGNEFAYRLDTNKIIHFLYENIPETYKQKYPYIVDIDEAGNPVLYYISIINYLNNNSIITLFIRGANKKWHNKIVESVQKMTHLPHIIVLEVYEEDAQDFNEKPKSFTINVGKYEIDSSVVRDISKQHFCATLTCEGREYGYDGASFHRMVPLQWKNKLNKDVNWQFEGSKDYDGTPLEWNFTKSYQMLLYYRVE